ncbi:MAG: helix-turn-helix domain-containing protein [Candidatus Kapabacteria bacterium]|nr:helix-turn-helix domain-containing protein [Candidatus Kapabacteria bacterium]
MMNDSNSDNLITPAELANTLSVSMTTVYRLIETRKIPFCKIGGSLRFKQDDVEKYIELNRKESIKELYERTQKRQ